MQNFIQLGSNRCSDVFVLQTETKVYTCMYIAMVYQDQHELTRMIDKNSVN